MDEKIKKVCRKFFVPMVPIAIGIGTKTMVSAYRSMLFFACLAAKTSITTYPIRQNALPLASPLFLKTFGVFKLNSYAVVILAEREKRVKIDYIYLTMRTLKTLSILSMTCLLWISAPAQESAPSDAPMSSVDLGFSFVQDNMIKAAEQMPEEYYDFRPTEEVKTFGEIIAHAAASNFFMWSMATGEPNPMPEIPSTKMEAIDALKRSYEIVGKARKTLTDEQKQRQVTFLGEPRAAGTVLDFSVFHGIEHYGNLVVYMRIKGLVPPSSQ